MLPSKDIDIENTEDPVVLEQLWVVAKVVTNWATRIKQKAVDLAKEGLEFPSLRLKSMGSPRKCVNNKKLMEIAEQYDLPQKEVLELARLPISAIATEVGRRAPKGEKGQASKDFLAALDDEDILVSSEKRYTLSEK